MNLLHILRLFSAFYIKRFLRYSQYSDFWGRVTFDLWLHGHFLVQPVKISFWDVFSSFVTFLEPPFFQFQKFFHIRPTLISSGLEETKGLLAKGQTFKI